MAEKRIELITCKVKDLKHGFKNPRKITKKKQAELIESLKQDGDFGVFVIDEDYNLIGGNQRANAMLAIDPEQEVTCKMLIGYTEQEKKAINIKDNTHSGEWDLEMLADWTAGLNLDFGIDVDGEHHGKSKKPKATAKLIRYDKYWYVTIGFRTEASIETMLAAFNLEGKETVIGDKNGKTIPMRVLWYEDVKDCFVRKECG